MTTHVVYVSGAPGAGKSTLMAALTGGCLRDPGPGPVPHDVLRHPDQPGWALGAELGVRREAFSGTDALSMSIQPAAAQWLGTHPYRLILGEGDRLANLKFLTACETLGLKVTLVHLDISDEVLAERWRWREHQDPSWRAGRVTKARRLADQWAINGGTALILDAGRLDPGQLVARVRAKVDDMGMLPRPRPVDVELPADPTLA